MLKFFQGFVVALCVVSLHARSVPLVFRNNDWATHQPVLCELVKKTKGPVIEFGCGDSSTRLLHEICRKEKRPLISVDDSAAWIKRCSEMFLGDGYERDNSGWHKFFFVPGAPQNPDPDDPAINGDYWTYFIENNELIQNTDFEVCFIDQWPWRGRVETIKIFKDKARYIVLHDCDFFVPKYFGQWTRRADGERNIPGVIDFSDIFRYFKVYYPANPWPSSTGPPTLIASNFDEDLPEIDYQNYPDEFVDD